ncbi:MULTISPECIES: hypothetical protein [Cupriavidus]|jgi:hypothetical protein|uniref:hypothetical protein n=1 Tax=Cupriavidus TaxID=106589 RepID=UPI000465696F|nr:hypothetical protein [Cupriavidus metallidurans]KWW32389.1 hypothetical protein AU374_05989 [Cupriavidus metallidurans]
MRKENVFLVTGRLSEGTASGREPRGELIQRIVCAANEPALHEFLEQSFPGFLVVGMVNLAALEDTARQIKAALAGTAGALPVFVDPSMSH